MRTHCGVPPHPEPAIVPCPHPAQPHRRDARCRAAVEPGGRPLGRLACLFGQFGRFGCLRWIGWFGVAAGASLSAPSALACWDEAARRYGINSALLYAIAQTESSLNPRAIGHNRNGSRDIGLMQINSWWLPRLAVYGLQERHLFDPCTNIHIGAWILAGNLHRLRDPWEAVGAYHARDPQQRRAYVQRIQRRLAQTTSPQPPLPYPTAASVSSSPAVTATTAVTAVASVTAPSRLAPPAAIAVFGSDFSTPRTPQELP